MQVAEGLGVRQRLGERHRRDLTLLGHFAYGAAVGALFPVAERRVPLPPLATGMALGLAVWTASYAGWIPLAGMMPPPARQPVRRNLLMIAAHCVWGAATAWIAGALARAGADAFARVPPARLAVR
jgi:uncharacterized membrane protein YagU involved in acid resistance